MTSPTGSYVLVRRVSIGILLVTLAAGVAAAGVEAPSESWCALTSVVTLGDEQAADVEGLQRSLELHEARYGVEVLGGMAVGALTLEFQNLANEPARVRYLSRVPAGLQIESLRAQIAGADESDWLELHNPAAQPKARAAAKASPRRATTPAPEPVQLTVGADERLTIHVGFRQLLPFRGDRYELLLPAIGGDCAERVGYWPDTGAPTGVMSASVRIHHDRELALAESTTHDVSVRFDGNSSRIELTADPYGDRALAIDFALGQTEEPSLTVFATPPVDDEREVMIVLSPALETVEESVRPKEALFVLDSSGSMQGDKLAKAVGALGACLERIEPQDLFNIVRFSALPVLLHAEPVKGDPGVLDDARQWMLAQRAGGGTQLLPALEAVFEQGHDEEHHRLVIVLSDGKLGDAKRVEEFVEQHLGEARLFLVGIGEDANEEGILRLAQLGRGTAVFAKSAEQLEAAVTELFAGISAPVAWDLKLHWGDAEVISMEPSRVPDLYAGRPVTIRARVRGVLPPDLLVEASTMDGVRLFQTAIPVSGAEEIELFRSR